MKAMNSDQSRIEISSMLESNIMQWAISYYDLVACKLILKAYNEPVTRTVINNSVNAECNSMLRKVSKFKPYMLENGYDNVCQVIQDLKTDTQNIIIKALKEDKGVMI